MSTPTPEERYAAFVRGVSELPPFTGITYRGALPQNTFRREGQVLVTRGTVQSGRITAGQRHATRR